MKRLLLFLCLLLLASCRGGGDSDSTQLGDGGESVLEPGLHLSWLAEDGGIAVTLTAGQAADLYQAAAVLTYPAEKYQLTEVAAGGGLGNAAETFFAGGETAPGRLEFGYTKRFAGPGEYGDVALLKFRLAETADFALKDFVIDFETAPPVLRDSRQQDIALPAAGVTQ